MTTFEFDLSKSDSFIDGIYEIFKPPSVETSTNIRNVSKSYVKSSNNQFSLEVNKNTDSASNYENNFDNKSTVKNNAGNTNWKKPKANTHDFCDSCGTFEGERLVCDRCPASFHLECLDPPIEIDEAPVGVWYCNRCTAIMKEEEDHTSSASGHSQRVENDNKVSNFSTKRSARSTSSGSSEVTTEMLAEDVPTKKKKSNDSDKKYKHLKAMKNLLDVIQCINPKEFELPKNLLPGIRLPGSFKTDAEMKTKSVISMENGIIPRPLVICSECSRTCFYGSLLQCDYCPLYFHLDCLEPPLVQLPSRVERWMCPNHIEQVVDNSGMIKTIRLSERLKIYDEIYKCISNIDEVDLLTDLASGRGFRFGSKDQEIIKEKPKIVVPDAVKRKYKLSIKVKTDSTEDEDKSLFSDDQKKVLQNILRVSGKEIDINDTDVVTLLQVTLDSIHDLTDTKLLHVSSDIQHKARATPRPGGDQVRCRALFIPISKDHNQENTSPPIRMIYRNFDIGSSIDNDCVVSGCKYVSARHASISYIDNHFCFELVNYSRYGTIVDDLLYYNDVSDKESFHHPPIGSATNQNVKDIKAFLGMGGGGGSSWSDSNKRLINSMQSQRDVDKTVDSCICSSYGYSNQALNDCTDRGWESTAPLRFGSVVRIGCQKFLFTEMSENNVCHLSRIPSSSVSSSISSTDDIVHDSPKCASKLNTSPKSEGASPGEEEKLVTYNDDSIHDPEVNGSQGPPRHLETSQSSPV